MLRINNKDSFLLCVLLLFNISISFSAELDTLRVIIPFGSSEERELFYNYILNPKEGDVVLEESKHIKGTYILDFRPELSRLRRFSRGNIKIGDRNPWLFKREFAETDTLSIPLSLFDLDVFRGMTKEELRNQKIVIALGFGFDRERSMLPLPFLFQRKYVTTVYYNLKGERIRPPFRDYHDRGEDYKLVEDGLKSFVSGYDYFFYQKNTRWIVVRRNDGIFEMQGGTMAGMICSRTIIGCSHTMESIFEKLNWRQHSLHFFCRHTTRNEPLFQYFIIKSSSDTDGYGQILLSDYKFGVKDRSSEVGPLKELTSEQQQYLDELIELVPLVDNDLFIRRD